MIACKVLIYLFHMFLLQYIENWKIKYTKKLCYGEINVLTRVQPNIAKQIYNIVAHICMYFSYYLL